MQCEWGDEKGFSPDGMNITLNATGTTTVGYQYEVHGEYTATCLMFNMVSNQSLTYNVRQSAQWFPGGGDFRVQN